MSPDPGMPAALARLRAFLAETPAGTPADWQREGLPLCAYGELPRLADGPAVAGGWPAEERPGPQPWNAGVTPGWPPEPPPPPELAAAVGELAHAARVAERVGAAARRADEENWQLAQWVAELERQLETIERELELLRGTTGHQAPGAGRGGARGQPPGADLARSALEGE